MHVISRPVPGPTADAQGRPHNTLDTVADRMLHLEKISLEDNLRLTFELLDTRRDGTMSVDTLQEVLKVAPPSRLAMSSQPQSASAHV